MAIATKYRFELDGGSRKFPCPQCGHKRFVRVVDHETGEYLPDHVGRCDREHSCGYSFSWKQYLGETHRDAVNAITDTTRPEQKPVDYLPLTYLERCCEPRHYAHNNFFRYLQSLFGEAVAWNIVDHYLIGTSRHWKGAAVFPQIDPEGNLHQLKIMLHDAITGKRIKAGAEVERYDPVTHQYRKEITDRSCALIYGRYIDECTKKLNLRQTFFGCHLLAEYPDKPVCIVESEKTAIIASVYVPSCIWLATGGASGCAWREYDTYKVLAGRSVTLFPDHGFFNVKSGKTCYEEWCQRAERIQEALPTATVHVSDLLEKRLADQSREDQDLADMLLVRDEQTGHALTDAGYPVIWDYGG